MQRLFVLLAIFAVGCGGGNPASPSPGFPTVAGSYAGTTTMTFPEIGETVVCPTTTSVTQNGGSLNIAPLLLGGPCGNVSIPFGSATIDETGAILGNASGSYNEPSCGTYNFVGSGGFFGRELRASFVYTSTTCLNMNITFNLSR